MVKLANYVDCLPVHVEHVRHFYFARGNAGNQKYLQTPVKKKLHQNAANYSAFCKLTSHQGSLMYTFLYKKDFIFVTNNYVLTIY